MMPMSLVTAAKEIRAWLPPAPLIPVSLPLLGEFSTPNPGEGAGCRLGPALLQFMEESYKVTSGWGRRAQDVLRAGYHLLG